MINPHACVEDSERESIIRNVKSIRGITECALSDAEIYAYLISSNNSPEVATSVICELSDHKMNKDEPSPTLNIQNNNNAVVSTEPTRSVKPVVKPYSVEEDRLIALGVHQFGIYTKNLSGLITKNFHLSPRTSSSVNGRIRTTRLKMKELAFIGNPQLRPALTLSPLHYYLFELERDESRHRTGTLNSIPLTHFAYTALLVLTKHPTDPIEIIVNDPTLFEGIFNSNEIAVNPEAAKPLQSSKVIDASIPISAEVIFSAEETNTSNISLQKHHFIAVEEGKKRLKLSAVDLASVSVSNSSEAVIPSNVIRIKAEPITTSHTRPTVAQQATAINIGQATQSIPKDVSTGDGTDSPNSAVKGIPAKSKPWTIQDDNELLRVLRRTDDKLSPDVIQSELFNKSILLNRTVKGIQNRRFEAKRKAKKLAEEKIFSSDYPLVAYYLEMIQNYERKWKKVSNEALCLPNTVTSMAPSPVNITSPTSFQSNSTPSTQTHSINVISSSISNGLPYTTSATLPPPFSYVPPSENNAKDSKLGVVVDFQASELVRKLCLLVDKRVEQENYIKKLEGIFQQCDQSINHLRMQYTFK